MQKLIKNLLRDKIAVVAVCITFIIIYLSIFKVPKVNINVVHLDKWQHSIAYFALSISWLLTFYKKPKKKFLVIILCIAFGIIIEVLQEVLTDYRTGDILDILANSLGVLLGLLFFNYIYKKKWLN